MIELDGVSVTNADSATRVLDDVSLHIPEGDLALVAGQTGSGKSTLLGCLTNLVPRFTGGHRTGRVILDGTDITAVAPRELADLIGYVGQNPLAGFVTDTVESELAFGMEQLGVDPSRMRVRVEEVLDLLGITDLRRRALRTLSGGQQQRVAIASVLTARPRVLVLDEPTSALDPVAAEDVVSLLSRLVHDLGLTVVMAEHRMERVVEFCDSVVLVSRGSVQSGSPREMLSISPVAPPLVELGRLSAWSPLPLTIRDGRRAARLERNAWQERSPLLATPTARMRDGLVAESVVVTYGSLVAVRGASLTAPAGHVTGLVGRNGCGKSSLLW
ncbi:MAG: ATP-binding cassette domain-containing protein, partial [Actinobacteria bacterium]|nr:ATP-binding cassette domain-containing protein [Actinomycetota bacterium]